MSSIEIFVNDDVMEKYQSVCKAIDMDSDLVVDIFIRTMLMQEGLPFDLKLDCKQTMSVNHE